MGMENAVEKLAPLAIAFVVVGIVIGFGAVVLGEMTDLDAVADTVLVEDQTATPEDTLPTNITGLNTPIDSTTVWLDEGADMDNLEELTQEEDYIVYNDEGNIEIQDSDALSTYDSESDQIVYDYEWLDSDTVANDTLNAALDALDTFGSFLGVIAIVALAAIIFVLLRVFGNNGNRRTVA